MFLVLHIKCSEKELEVFTGMSKGHDIKVKNPSDREKVLTDAVQQ